MIVLFVVSKARQRNFRPDRRCFHRDNSFNLPLFKASKDFRVGITGVRRRDLYRRADYVRSGVEPGKQVVAFVDFAGCNFDIENDAAQIVDDPMLLITGLQFPIS